MHEPNLDQRVWEVGAQHGQSGGVPGDFPLTRVNVAQDLAHQGACGDTPFTRELGEGKTKASHALAPPNRGSADFRFTRYLSTDFGARQMFVF